MSKVKIAMPLHGKMALRSFHSRAFREALASNDFEPVYFLGPHYYKLCNPEASEYVELKINEYDNAVSKRRHINSLSHRLRRFGVITETTDLRFRDSIEEGLFGASVFRAWSSAAFFDILRHLPGIERLAFWLENSFDHVGVHCEMLRDSGVNCALTPSMGLHTFEYEGLFAKEAQKIGLPVFAAITNYDNIVNRGFRGFTPKCVAVWSKLMADDTMRLQKLPASKIEITGPAQFDHYFRPPERDREMFLSQIGLDPAKKTVLFAGGVNITRYFEIYRLFVDPGSSGLRSDCNLAIRPYPHPKLLSSPSWQVLEELFQRAEGVFISLPPANEADDVVDASMWRDLSGEDDLDHLHCLLLYSDVMLNIFSTISLEAAICDLPTIHMGYDLYTYGHRYNMTTSFQQRQTHNRRPLRLAAAKIAHDEAELVQAIKQYLRDRSLDKDKRLDYALSECEFLDGKSSQRLVDMVSCRLANWERMK